MISLPAPWKRRVAAIGAGALLAVAGSGVAAQGDDAGTAPPPPKVIVAEVREQSVPVEHRYTGTTAAVKAIELRSQITGYLLERKFSEGTNVKKDDVLYLIDPRPFKAVLDQRQAELEQQEAILKYAKAEFDRYSELASRGNASQERLDQAVELQSKTEAAIAVSRAEIHEAKINLEFTTIEAPFDGRVGRTLVNIGGLVQANNTALASLVQLDPIYAYFNPPETELLRIEASQAQAPLKVEVTLPNTGAEPLEGTLSFIGNAVDAGTGTIDMRATVENPDQRLRPGQFVLVRLRIADDHHAMVVPAKAISSVQGQRFALVVGKDDKLERRTVELGRQVGTDRYVVESGLSQGDLVVVSDTQTLKSGMTVSPQRQPSS